MLNTFFNDDSDFDHIPNLIDFFNYINCGFAIHDALEYHLKNEQYLACNALDIILSQRIRSFVSRL